MAQVLKDHIRNQILAAAESRFAEVGFAQATIGSIAQEAEVATGTVYTYFPNKKVLFHSVVTEEFVGELSRLTRNSIASFAQPGWMEADRAGINEASAELLRFFAENRCKAVILLHRGQGTDYEGFVQDYVSAMQTQTLGQVAGQFPDLEITPAFRFMVRAILEESVRMIAAILMEFDDEQSIHTAFAAKGRYQLAGMGALVQWACAQGGQR